jgi:hypothetical protein
MYPNSALSAWQLAAVAVVPVTALAVWLTAIFLAARGPRRDRAAVASPDASIPSLTAVGADELSPPRQAAA